MRLLERREYGNDTDGTVITKWQTTCHPDPAAFAEGISQRDRFANFVIGGRRIHDTEAVYIHGVALSWILPKVRRTPSEDAFGIHLALLRFPKGSLWDRMTMMVLRLFQ